MKIFEETAQLRAYLHSIKASGGSIGLVPTMGYLHQGHISLVEQSKRENSTTVCSIFVNPVQFNNPNDLATYPRHIDNDTNLLKVAHCDVLFLPSEKEMYPKGYGQDSVKMSFGALETRWEGAFRPGHFNGVGVVVSKLFNIIEPHRAYFGQKDLQQYLIIKKMVEDLSFGLEVVRCPIIREPDGLAMSSRNVRLSGEERKLAIQLYQALSKVRQALLSGLPVAQAQQEGADLIAKFPAFKLEYLAVVDVDNMKPVVDFRSPSNTAVCVAAHLGNTRLIDNIIVSEG